MMTKEQTLAIMRQQGMNDALDLRARAPQMDGTAIIDEENKIPTFDETKDYSAWIAGSPVCDEGQIWTLIIPHDAANYSGRPSTLRAMWGLCHTKNPAKAKAWVDPFGTSGMYMLDECYQDEDGNVWRCNQDNTIYDAKTVPALWTVVTFE